MKLGHFELFSEDPKKARAFYVYLRPTFTDPDGNWFQLVFPGDH